MSLGEILDMQQVQSAVNIIMKIFVWILHGLADERLCGEMHLNADAPDVTAPPLTNTFTGRELSRIS